MNTISKLTKLMLILVTVCLGSLFVTACSSIKPYEADIQQGNIIDPANIDKLRLGMQKTEVLFLLGAPVLHHTFDDRHLIYVCTKQVNGGNLTIKRLSLEFDNNILISIKKS